MYPLSVNLAESVSIIMNNVYWNIVVIISVIMGIVGVIGYFYDRHKKRESVDPPKHKNLPENIEILRIEKVIFFEDASIDNKEVNVMTTHIIKNLMKNQIYHSYNFKISSDIHVPKFEEITFLIDGTPLKSFNSMIEPPIIRNTYETKNDNRADVQFSTASFNIPIDLKPEELCKISLQYKTKAYKDVFLGKTDYISIFCPHITKEILFKIFLQKPLNNIFEIESCGLKNEDGTQLTFKIFDFTGQRMYDEESELKDKQIVPTTKQNVLTWKINNPKITFSYLLFFTLKKM